MIGMATFFLMPHAPCPMSCIFFAISLTSSTKSYESRSSNISLCNMYADVQCGFIFFPACPHGNKFVFFNGSYEKWSFFIWLHIYLSTITATGRNNYLRVTFSLLRGCIKFVFIILTAVFPVMWLYFYQIASKCHSG